MGKDNIALIGMMGCGKSASGKKVAKILNSEYIDLDDEFEKMHGPIELFFEKHGEERFRTEEEKLLEKHSQRKGIILSTGGGVVKSERNRKILDGMNTFYLEDDIEELWKRVKATKRPLVKKGKDFFTEVYSKRKPLYERYETIKTKGLRPFEIAAKVSREFLDDSVFYESEGVQRVRIFHGKSAEPYDLNLVAKKPAKIWEIDGVPIEDGEDLKDNSRIVGLWDLFLERKLSRASVVRATGGGTVTDAVGFAALTFMRGVNLVLVPTTLLGMVDASIGGKFAMNHGGVKNLVGTFGTPEVLVEPAVSLSLEEERFKEGIVEALKLGAVYDRVLFEHIEKNIDSLLERRIDLVNEMVVMAVKDKLEIVEKDPHDHGTRHILNFGHTIGHAIEGMSGNSISHGRAVALGMIAESKLFSPKLHERLKKTVDALGFQGFTSNDPERWLMADKKRIDSGVVIPVIDEIGRSHLEKRRIGEFIL